MRGFENVVCGRSFHEGKDFCIVTAPAWGPRENAEKRRELTSCGESRAEAESEGEEGDRRVERGEVVGREEQETGGE